MMLERSFLFVPGDRPEKFAKAQQSGAHRIVLDLEDSVAANAKDTARKSVFEWIRGGGTALVRINGLGTPWHEGDLNLTAQSASLGAMLPKANRSSLASVRAGLRPQQSLVALIETVEGLFELRMALASVPNIARLAFGNVDFGADSGILGTGNELDSVRIQLALESRHAGLPPPIDGVSVALADPKMLAKDIERARNQGFGGKLCIHPMQVAAVNEGFRPSDQEIEWAKRIVAIFEDRSQGVAAVDGQMVDKATLERARAVLGAS
jgi:citrate lyase subunit beta / citryl-CoA lyase